MEMRVGTEMAELDARFIELPRVCRSLIFRKSKLHNLTNNDIKTSKGPALCGHLKYQGLETD